MNEEYIKFSHKLRGTTTEEKMACLADRCRKVIEDSKKDVNFGSDDYRDAYSRVHAMILESIENSEVDVTNLPVLLLKITDKFINGNKEPIGSFDAACIIENEILMSFEELRSE